MKTIKVVQNSQEWYDLRKNVLGASDSNIIMGKSQFMTPLQLWKQKIGLTEHDPDDTNFIQAKGHRLEEKMRGVVDFEYDTELEPIVVTSEEYPFLMCSLDGYSENIGFTWENKYVGQDDFKTVKSGKMLDKYYPQVQHQLMLTGAPFCVFTVVTEDKETTAKDFPFKYCHLEVQPDHNYMKKSLLPSLVKFWDMVQKKKQPPLSENDIVEFDQDQEMIDLLYQYENNNKILDELSKKSDEIKKAIFKKLGKAKKGSCNGIKITNSKTEDKVVADKEKYLFEMYKTEDKKELEKLLIQSGYEKIQKGRSTKRITFPKKQDS